MKASEVQEAITDRTVQWIQEHDEVPWVKPWDVSTGRPRSMSTRKHYRGMNIWALALTAMNHPGYSSWWGTYSRIAQLSGMVYDPKRKRYVSPDDAKRGVRKGEHGTRVYYWEVKHYPDPGSEDPEHERTFLFAKADIVFNAAQADGLPEEYYQKATERELGELPQPQIVLEEYLRDGPDFREEGDKAYYEFSNGLDRITIPERKRFHSAEDRYWTAFHEAVHSAGSPKRLNRPGIEHFDHFGSGQYGQEELVAQMGAAMLAAMTGIETPDTTSNSSAYVASWLRAIRGDITLIPKAAKLAQEAVDFILGEKPDTEGR